MASRLERQFDPPALPARLQLTARRHKSLRYGENPHQKAACYELPNVAEASIVHACQHQGRSLSYNNVADANAALECAKWFTEPTCAIVKHCNPCGVASAGTLEGAYQKAYACDPTSAFGGIVAVNGVVDGKLAERVLERQFVEVLVAPGYTDSAIKKCAAKQSLRVLACEGDWRTKPSLHITQISGGLLVQERDSKDDDGWEVVSKKALDSQQKVDLEFAWKVARVVKSNAIVFAHDRQSIGIGAGQPNRLYSIRIAAMSASDNGFSTQGAVMASDAFLPFGDNIEAARKAGISAIIQPGGSVRDREIIAAADACGMSMVFTRRRHFRH